MFSAHQASESCSTATLAVTVDPANSPMPRERRANRGDLAEDAAVRAGVRHHRRVPLFGACPGLPPLEEQRAVRAARDVAEGVPQDLPRLLRQRSVAVVDGAGALFHQQPRPAAREGAGPVGAERRVGGGVDAGRVRVVVDGDQVDLAAERPQVQVLVTGQHQVGGHRPVAVRADRVALLAVGGEGLVGPEAAGSPALGRGCRATGWRAVAAPAPTRCSAGSRKRSPTPR